ncbi:MAG: phosphohistidine phosphatase [Mobiluncus sp.]|uniref:Phosphohistidine phosphatase n=1 Tax=Mobiluncus porci TaxID=2652278 RepID=A0A7K0JZS1_9ACTO|nr:MULTISPECIES: phosphohistidine phosphatase [Mobiluncus]MCI6585280.1 phosphohistidine phosphatase [Mobiluncus sp.]MST48746.1 phosphohistidine phosphatase [Mobiluncus porci]
MNNTHTLVLLRHSKAGHAATDFERPLTEHGRETARLQGSVMARTVGKIDLALVSAATRTRQTTEYLHYGGLEIEAFQYERSLYANNNASATLDLIREVDEEADTLLVVMHEPAVSELALRLCEPEDGAQILTRGLSTATFAWGTLDVPWKELHTWKLGGLVPPSM